MSVEDALGDVFVAHAAKDKGFVKLFVDALIRNGLNPWYDDYEIEIGDSVQDKINEGLSNARFGVVVLSRNFFARDWPRDELKALRILLGRDKVLPLLLDMKHSDLVKRFPLLADTKAIPVQKMDPAAVLTAADSITVKIRGKVAKDDEGRQVYRNMSLRVIDVQNSFGQIVSTIFENCVIQGPAVIYNVGSGGPPTELDACWIEESMFYEATGVKMVGAVGLNNVVFRKSRFKQVTIIMSSTERRIAFDSGPGNQHLTYEEWSKALPANLR